MKIIIMGFVSAMIALLGYNIFESISGKWLKHKQFKTMADNLKFSEEASSYLWKKARRKLGQLLTYNKKGKQVFAKGFEIAKISDALQEEIRSGLPQGYQTFICDFDQKHKTLGVIKGTDKYAILKTMQTNGDTQGINNSKLINELRNLEKIAPFSIIGAGYDWLDLVVEEIRNESGSQAVDSILDKITEICPPQDDPEEHRKNLGEELMTANRVFLWWPMKPENQKQEENE